MLETELLDIVKTAGLEAENKTTWKYVKEVKNKKLSESYANLMDMKYIPKNLHKFFMNYSNGRPSKRKLKVNGKEIVIKRVLPLDEEAGGNVFKIYTAIKDKIAKNMIPFMETESGDMILMSTQGAVHVWFHDKSKTVKVAKSLDEFLNKLFD